MNLNDVHRKIRRNKARKRLGRGIGSGQGKTAGRGHKGQGSRSGSSAKPTFQGGTMPLIRRIPKRGFNNRWAKQIAIVNIGDLGDYFQDGDSVTPEALAGHNLAKRRCDELKVLGNGELTKKLKISAHRFSKAASEKIVKAGGEVIVLPGKVSVRSKQRAARNRAANEATSGKGRRMTKARTTKETQDPTA
jgi:large subunit ribosomal protein L15